MTETSVIFSKLRYKALEVKLISRKNASYASKNIIYKKRNNVRFIGHYWHNRSYSPHMRTYIPHANDDDDNDDDGDDEHDDDDDDDDDDNEQDDHDDKDDGGDEEEE